MRGKIDKMFGGVHINTTEDRSVLHAALRAPRDAVSAAACCRSSTGLAYPLLVWMLLVFGNRSHALPTWCGRPHRLLLGLLAATRHAGRSWIVAGDGAKGRGAAGMPQAA